MGEIRDLLQTLLNSGPAIVNVAGILALVMFIYAVLGMQIFTFVMQNDGINNNANFETFGGAVLVLFQVLTGDSWSSVMNGLMVGPEEGCDPNPSDGTPTNCGSMLSIPFFVSFILIGSFIFLNLVVAIVLDSFSQATRLREETRRRRDAKAHELVGVFHLDDFTKYWSEFDSNGDNHIRSDRFPYVIAQLAMPFGTAPAEAEVMESTEEAMEAVAAAAATSTADQSTWTPSVPLEQLEQAKAVLATLQSSFKLKPSANDEVHFGQALEALIEHAYTVNLKDGEEQPIERPAEQLDGAHDNAEGNGAAHAQGPRKGS